MTASEDIIYMRRALQLALCGEAAVAPNPMVGAVIVHKGRIIGEGYHRRCGGPHAEVNAVRSVALADQTLLGESCIYVTLEPCAHWGKTPPCADLIIEKRIPRVVVGCKDPFSKVDGLGIKKLQDAGCEVVVGVLEEECLELNRVFMTYHSKHRPFVTLKWAQRPDGSVNGQISTPFTQMLVHRLRARCGAILVGTGTMLADHPSLTVRDWSLRGEQPLRVTIDRHNRLPKELTDGFLVYHTETLEEILADLYRRGVQHLLVEGGPTLHRSFMEAGLYDEVHIETSDKRSDHSIDGHTIERRRISQSPLRGLSEYE
jgi:diaminohydroxyphosphoribosylaminopyrimidine deaminase/5-amino-6-(5-phosphoribosylamino)uracil reductase